MSTPRLMRAAMALVLVAAAPALAQQSCFTRVYSPEHLAKNPNQSVREMQVVFEGLAEGPGTLGTSADVAVWFRDDHRRWTAGFYCPPEAEGGTLCAIDCDGGAFRARWKGADTILLTTEWGFNVGAGCGDGEDEETRVVKDEGAERTTYLLRRAPMSACPAEWVQ